MHAARRRRGFTLLEVLLVLAVATMIIALTWPVLQGVYQIRQLKAVAAEIRAVWAEARNSAVDAGESWAFQYLADGRDYKIGPYPPSAPQSAASMPGAQPAQTQEIVERLPEPFEFRVGTIDDNRGQMQQPMGFGPSGVAAAGGSWSAPIMFYPDGTTSDAQLILADKQGHHITLSLRATTGTSRAGDVWKEGTSP